MLQTERTMSIMSQRSQESYQSGRDYGLTELLNALGSSMAVKSHLDFYTWLQKAVGPVLPHELLLSVSGNFQSGRVSIDVASSLEGVNTQTACASETVPAYLQRIHMRLGRHGNFWFLEQRPHPGSDFVSLALACGIGSEMSALFKSVLTCLLRDEKNGEESLYVFFSLSRNIDLGAETLNLLLPHIDAASRRVKLLKVGLSGKTQPGSGGISLRKALSDRENEIMDWVCEGKSNIDIGSILGISHNTVKNHLKKIFSKMDVCSRSQAVRVYMRLKEVS